MSEVESTVGPTLHQSFFVIDILHHLCYAMKNVIPFLTCVYSQMCGKEVDNTEDARLLFVNSRLYL